MKKKLETIAKDRRGCLPTPEPLFAGIKRNAGFANGETCILPMTYPSSVKTDVVAFARTMGMRLG